MSQPLTSSYYGPDQWDQSQKNPTGRATKDQRQILYVHRSEPSHSSLVLAGARARPALPSGSLPAGPQRTWAWLPSACWRYRTDLRDVRAASVSFYSALITAHRCLLAFPLRETKQQKQVQGSHATPLNVSP